MKSNDKTGKSFGGKILWQIFFVIGFMIALTIVIVLLVNTFFIKKIYLRQKSNTLMDSYDKLENACIERILYKKNYASEFDKMCVTGNLSIVIMSSDGRVVMSSSGSQTSASLVQQFMGNLFHDADDEDIYYTTSSYTIEKQNDRYLDSEFLVLWGSLPDGNTVVIRTAVDSIIESADISNQFLVLAGIISLIISLIIAALLSKFITKPVTELSSLSVKMKNLDFDARYKTRKRPNEIDELGNNFNEMSETLKNTIAELKKANIELMHDLEIRDQSEAMRKDFLSNVSHELKTPIALIQGYAEGLIDGVADNPEDMKYYLDVITDESKKMNHLVQQLLTLNQLEFGYNDFDLERFDIVPLVSALIHNSSMMMEKEGIKVEFDDSKRVYVWSDEFFAEEIVNNYLSNAIHYANGDKIIKVSLEKQGEKGIRLSVFNTGDRIPEDSLPHLFEKFYKVDKARSREYGGSGIGLSVVKALGDIANKDYGAYNTENGVVFYYVFESA